VTSNSLFFQVFQITGHPD